MLRIACILYPNIFGMRGLLCPPYAVYRYFVVKTDPFTEHTVRPLCLRGKRPVGW